MVARRQYKHDVNCALQLLQTLIGALGYSLLLQLYIATCTACTVLRATQTRVLRCHVYCIDTWLYRATCTALPSCSSAILPRLLLLFRCAAELLQLYTATCTLSLPMRCRAARAQDCHVYSCSTAALPRCSSSILQVYSCSTDAMPSCSSSIQPRILLPYRCTAELLQLYTATFTLALPLCYRVALALHSHVYSCSAAALPSCSSSILPRVLLLYSCTAELLQPYTATCSLALPLHCRASSHRSERGVP